MVTLLQSYVTSVQFFFTHTVCMYHTCSKTTVSDSVEEVRNVCVCVCMQYCTYHDVSLFSW